MTIKDHLDKINSRYKTGISTEPIKSFVPLNSVKPG
jgi:hypothetical protein